QDSRSVTEFFSALKILWEELELYLPIPVCTCPVKCSCESMRSARNNHNLMYVIRFLTGLNSQFDIVKSQILLMDPLPPLNKIFSMVIQHERQTGFIASDDSKALINAMDSKRSGFKPPRSGFASSSTKRTCTFCGRDNHVVDT
ncbi:retrovirus-related pol polyprotein from transposon TNT 1-94, partial [Trifolium medium]|nr:retrovirus-related pol polyprotein from transposon TNT 1-94 [Trifolium medium]